jgi:hypothetical protein
LDLTAGTKVADNIKAAIQCHNHSIQIQDNCHLRSLFSSSSFFSYQQPLLIQIHLLFSFADSINTAQENIKEDSIFHHNNITLLLATL